MTTPGRFAGPERVAHTWPDSVAPFASSVVALLITSSCVSAIVLEPTLSRISPPVARAACNADVVTLPAEPLPRITGFDSVGVGGAPPSEERLVEDPRRLRIGGAEEAKQVVGERLRRLEVHEMPGARVAVKRPSSDALPGAVRVLDPEFAKYRVMLASVERLYTGCRRG